MLKTRFFIAAFVLAAVFLVSASVKADSVTFDFERHKNDPGMLKDFSTSLLNLTAVPRNDGKGIDFTFVSKWAGGNPDVGKGGIIWDFENKGPEWTNQVHLSNHGDVLGKTIIGLNHVDTIDVDTRLLSVETTGLSETEPDIYGVKFSVGYHDNYGWSDFIDIVKDDSAPFGFQITISGDNALRPQPPQAATFVTLQGKVVPEEAPSPTPEPATLLILGGGLAGLGIAARRRKK